MTGDGRFGQVPQLDAASVVRASRAASPGRALPAEDEDLVRRCRRPHTVGELAADLDLPVDVVIGRLGELIAAGRMHVARPVQPDELPEQPVLRDVLSRLRSL